MVIDENGNQLGVKKVSEALALALQSGFDLVCVAPNAKTPVCRFMDYSKYRYEQQKRAREAKKNQTVISVKEVWITPVIGGNDFETKLKQGRKFLKEGSKLKVTLKYRSYRMLNLEGPNATNLERFIEGTEDIATVEQKPVLEGKNMSIVLVPKKEKKK